MDRRCFLGLLAGCSVQSLSKPALAQSRKRVALVLGSGTLSGPRGPMSETPARGFVEGLIALGWIEGQTLELSRHSAEGSPQKAAEIFADLAHRGVDAIFLSGDRWLLEAGLEATRRIPIVAMFADDPVASGYIASLGRPGGNLTGIASTTGRDLNLKRLELLRELNPAYRRIALLTTSSAWRQHESGAPIADIAFLPVTCDRPDQVEAALSALVREKPDAVVITGGPVNYINRQQIAAHIASLRLPAIHAFREAAEAGGLMSYGPDVVDLFRQAGRLVDRILKGASPAELPAEQPTKIELVLNKSAAALLGIEFPNSLLLRANDVIE